MRRQTFWMLATSAIQGTLASLDDGAGATVMDHRRCQPVQARMIVTLLYQPKKSRQNALASWMQPKRSGSPADTSVFLNWGLGERVVIGDMRSGMGLGHPQIREQ